MSSRLQTTIILALLLAQSSHLITIYHRHTSLSKTSVSNQQKFVDFENLKRFTLNPSSTSARILLEYTENAFIRVARSLQQLSRQQHQVQEQQQMGPTEKQSTSATCEKRLKLEYYNCVVRALSRMPAIAIRHAIASRMEVQRTCLSKTLRNVKCLIGPHHEDHRAS